MGNWKSALRADPTDWLLEKDNPSVRYLALTDLIGVPANDPQAREAKRAIMETGLVSRILAKQEVGGYWDKPESCMLPSTKGLYGNLSF